jgi:hypothetical protein
MPESLQNKLHQYEVTPPSSVWDKIAAQLDEEFVSRDSQLAEKIDNITVPPPDVVWQNIAEQLQSDEAPTERSKVIPLVYRRIAIAAIVSGVLAVAAMYLFTSNRSANQRDEYVTTPKTKDVITVPQNEPGKADSGRAQSADQKNIAKRPANNKPQIASVQRIRFVSVNRSQPVAVADEANTYIPDGEYADSDFSPQPEEAPLYELHTVSALQPVSVSAPPLRDKKGNIILDLATISRPNDPYIVVTGPNGKQTRISSKFLSCLGYINSRSSENDARGSRCISKFDEWRERLIAEPGFIPTANNFFDIFELKDLVQDM